MKIVDSGDVDIIERIKSCSSQIKDDFILLYGDTLANVNLEHLQKFHFSLWFKRQPLLFCRSKVHLDYLSSIKREML